MQRTGDGGTNIFVKKSAREKKISIMRGCVAYSRSRFSGVARVLVDGASQKLFCFIAIRVTLVWWPNAKSTSFFS